MEKLYTLLALAVKRQIAKYNFGVNREIIEDYVTRKVIEEIGGTGINPQTDTDAMKKFISSRVKYRLIDAYRKYRKDASFFALSFDDVKKGVQPDKDGASFDPPQMDTQNYDVDTLQLALEAIAIYENKAKPNKKSEFLKIIMAPDNCGLPEEMLIGLTGMKTANAYRIMKSRALSEFFPKEILPIMNGEK